jgi:TM2 domain-containing membrane protein YozV
MEATYTIKNGSETKGPLTLSQLRSMWNAGTITGDTPLLEDGQHTWMTCQTIIDRLEPSEGPSSVASRFNYALKTQSDKGRTAYVILGLFLGVLGIHNFYSGHWPFGVIKLVILVVLGWLFGIGFFINAVWSLYEICTVTKDAKGLKFS